MKREEIKVSLRRGTDAAGELTAVERDAVESLVEAGEELVAFEILATQINEYSISLPPKIRQELLDAGMALGVDSYYLDLLTEESD